MRPSLLLTSKYESHCRQTCLLLATYRFCAGDEYFWRWRKTLLALEKNAFGARDERIWARDEHFKWLLELQLLTSETGTTTLGRSKGMYVIVQQRLQLHWIGLQGRINWENRTSTYSQLHTFSIPGVAWLTCHTWLDRTSYRRPDEGSDRAETLSMKKQSRHLRKKRKQHKTI